MTKLARLRAVDWTLSATPTRRGVRVFLLAYLGPLVLAGICALALLILIRIESGPPTPERSFTSMDFLPPTSVYPADYEVIDAPSWAGPDSRGGLGDEDDAYASYKPVREAFGHISVSVYYQSHWNDAVDEYEYGLIFLTGYEPNSAINFQSERAQQQTLVCKSEPNIDGWRWCRYIARYDEFVVDVHAAVGPDQLSVAEFENVLQAIEERAIELLGPTPIPKP